MFRTRALAVAAVASTALALTACGSDSLSEGDLVEYVVQEGPRGPRAACPGTRPRRSPPGR